MKWVALIYAAEWISVGLAVSTAIHVTGDLRALWFFLIPALSGVKYHEDDGGREKMSCLSCENYIPIEPSIQRTDAQGQTYTVPGLCKIGADHIICGLPVYLPTAKCDKIIEAPPQDGS